MRLALALVLALVPTLAFAAAFPERPVTAIVGYPAGGLADVTLRAMVEGMKKKFPKGIAVVNRPGAGGSIGASEVIQSKPDGYTFGIMPISNLVIQPQVLDLPFRTPDDYVPIINLVSWYPLLAVKQDAPWKTAQELVAAAKAAPGKLRVGTPGEGTSSHLNLEELKRLADANLVHVPFSGWAEGSPALLGGHIEALVAQPGELRGQVEGKRMRVLVNFRPQRMSAFADVPTAKELGWDVANGVWYMLLAPKGTPAPVLRYLHDAAKAAIDDPKFAADMTNRGIDVDYRPGNTLRADLWREYKVHTAILQRIGMLKK